MGEGGEILPEKQSYLFSQFMDVLLEQFKASGVHGFVL